jgi:hypothetical protein
MILAILEPTDRAALWLCHELSGALASEIKLVTPTQLICSRSLEQRLSSTDTSWNVVLANGETISSASVSGVINRLGTSPTAHLQRATAGDRDYAGAELHAFLLGWLAAMPCPVLNPPAPNSLWGAGHGSLEVAHFAAQCGLDMAQNPAAAAPTGSHFVLDGQLIGSLASRDLRERLLQLASLWGARLVQFDVTMGEGSPKLANVSSFVNFERGGSVLLRAIAKALGA